MKEPAFKSRTLQLNAPGALQPMDKKHGWGTAEQWLNIVTGMSKEAEMQ